MQQICSALILLLFFGANESFSQTTFEGKVFYQEQRHMDIELKSDEVSKALKESIMKGLKNLSRKEYVLTFDQAESLYREKESLGTPSVGSGNITTVSFGSSGNGRYRNIAKKRSISEEGILGKAFLVKEEIEKPDWELVNETKKIGKYIAFKAVLKKEVEVHDFLLNQEDKDNEEEETKTEIRTTTVWYTPQIPVHHGPGIYWGLPGLILEVQKENYRLLATKVIINPTEGIEIEAPDEGKEIGREKFEKLQEKKMEEWMKRHASKDGSGFSITIEK